MKDEDLIAQLDQHFNSALNCAHALGDTLNGVAEMCTIKDNDSLDLKKFKSAMVDYVSAQLQKLAKQILN